MHHRLSTPAPKSDPPSLPSPDNRDHVTLPPPVLRLRSLLRALLEFRRSLSVYGVAAAAAHPVTPGTRDQEDGSPIMQRGEEDCMHE